MRHRHAHFSSSTQLPALIKASRQSVDRIPAASCPLCHWDATLRDLTSHISADETVVVTTGQFRQHLGAHMEQLALFALPRSYEYEEENEEKSIHTNDAAAMAHSDSRTRHLLSEEMSWKTVSSPGVASDKVIPDVGMSIAPNISVHSRDLYPWSQQPLDMSAFIFKPFPRSGLATGQLCSKGGCLYIQGGEFDGDPVDHDVWTIETNETPTCYSIATNLQGPGKRMGHAALLVGNTFIVYGGHGYDKNGPHLDEELYLLNTSETDQLYVGPRLT